jgi:hypothetical protein
MGACIKDIRNTLPPAAANNTPPPPPIKLTLKKDEIETDSYDENDFDVEGNKAELIRYIDDCWKREKTYVETRERLIDGMKCTQQFTNVVQRIQQKMLKSLDQGFGIELSEAGEFLDTGCQSCYRHCPTNYKPPGPAGRPCHADNLYKFPKNFKDLPLESLIQTFTEIMGIENKKRGKRSKKQSTARSTKAKKAK